MFETPSLVIRDLAAGEVPLLQALFDANPDYFERFGGQPPRPDEAAREFAEEVPPHLPHGIRRVAGAFDRSGTLRATLVFVTDLSAPGVWHIALLFLDRSLRGTGAAAELHRAFEAFARQGGARWLRLAAVDGNTTAERFWHRQGYAEVRTRPYTNAAGQAVITRVLVKPIGGEGLDGYLARVPRDAPGSPLP